MRCRQKRPFTRRIAYENVSQYIDDLAKDSDEENDGLDGVELDSFANANGTRPESQESCSAYSARSRDTIDLGIDRHEKISPVSPVYQDEEFRSSKQTLSKMSTFAPDYEFGWLDLLVGVGAVLFFFLDLGTDTNLTAKYFINQEWVNGAVTTALTAGPSIITCALGIHWYILDYKVEKKMLDCSEFTQEKKDFYRTPSSLWGLRFVMTISQLGPVMRYSEYMWYGWQSRSAKNVRYKRRYHRLMLYEDVDAGLLRLFEAFLEAAPQLTYQLYIWITLRPHESTIELSARLAAMMSSWLSLAVALASYHRSLRFSRAEKCNMSLFSMVGYSSWRAFEVGGRVLCIAMFASAFQVWVFLPILLHWFAASLWLMCQRVAFYEHAFLDKAFDVICGYVMIFCFLNLREGATRWRYFVFYMVFYAENGAMTFAWLFFAPEGNPWYHLYGFIIVVSSVGVHILLQLLYYYVCHPGGNIRICLPCDRNSCHESVCSDLADEDVEEGVIGHREPRTIKDVYKSDRDQDGYGHRPGEKITDI